VTQADTTECPHCHAPREASGKVRDGERIYCRKCHKWFTVRRWVTEKVTPPEEVTNQVTSAPLAAPSVSLDRSAVLPDDLLQLGFKLVFYEQRMVAVSVSWGCSAASADLAEVVRSARNIVGFIRYVKGK